MKTFLIILTIAFAAPVLANPNAQPGMQDYQQIMQKMQSMSPEQQQQFMQQMQQKAMQAQACLQNVDQQKMDAIAAKGKEISDTVEKLCAAGKTAQAEKYAMDEGMKLVNDPTVKKLQSCSQDMAVTMNDMFPSLMNTADAKPGTICD